MNNYVYIPLGTLGYATGTYMADYAGGSSGGTSTGYSADKTANDYLNPQEQELVKSNLTTFPGGQTPFTIAGYTFNSAGQYESAKLSLQAQGQQRMYDARKASMGIVEKTPTLVTAPNSTTPGSSGQPYLTKQVNFEGGRYIPEGRQAPSSPLVARNETLGIPFGRAGQSNTTTQYASSSQQLANAPSSTTSSNTISGIDLFNPANRAAIQEGTRQGLYTTAGEIFSGKTNPQFTPEYGISTPKGEVPFSVAPINFTPIPTQDKAQNEATAKAIGATQFFISAQETLSPFVRQAKDEAFYGKILGINNPLAYKTPNATTIYSSAPSVLKSDITRSIYQNPFGETPVQNPYTGGPPGLNPIKGMAQFQGGVAQTGFNILQGVAGIPNDLRREPLPSIAKAEIEAPLAYLGGKATGEAVGGIVRSAEVRSGSGATVSGLIDTGFITLGTAGAVANPTATGKELPYIALGVKGFGEGFNSIAKNELSFSPIRSGKSTVRNVDVSQYSGTEENIFGKTVEKVNVDVTSFGVQKTTTGEVTTVVKGTPAYDRSQQGFDITVDQSIKVPAIEGTSFKGVSSQRTIGTGATGISGGSNYFATSIDNGNQLFFSRQSSGNGKSVVDTMTLAKNKDGFYTVVSEGVGTGTQGGFGYRKVNALPFNNDVLLTSSQGSFVGGTSKTVVKPSTAGDTELFNKGFELLGTRGFSTKLPSQQGVSDVFFNPRVTRMYSVAVPVPEPVRDVNIIPRPFEGSLGTPAYREGFSTASLPTPAPAIEGTTRPFAVFAPSFGIGGSRTITGGSSVSYPTAPSFTTEVTSNPVPKIKADIGTSSLVEPQIIPSSISRPIVVPDVITSGVSTPGVVPTIGTGFSFTPPSPVFPNNPPAIPPPIPIGIPNFGFDNPRGKSGRGRKQGFFYAPSLTSIAFNIRGKQPKGQLTGFEVRPLPVKRGKFL